MRKSRVFFFSLGPSSQQQQVADGTTRRQTDGNEVTSLNHRTSSEAVRKEREFTLNMIYKALKYAFLAG